MAGSAVFAARSFTDHINTTRISSNTILNSSRMLEYSRNPSDSLGTIAAAVLSPDNLAATLTGSYDDVDESQGHATMMMLAQSMMSTPGQSNATTMGVPVVSEALKNHTVMVSCLMFGAGVLGNLLALFVLAKSNADQRKTLFYKLVAGLAVTDLLGTTATSPVVIAVYLNSFRWVGGEAVCQYFSFAMIFACFSTMLIVCAMSVERYICVRHPYIYHTRLSGTKFARLTLLTCWAVSILVASLPLIGVGTYVKQLPKTWCFFNYLSRQPTDMAFSFIFAGLALLCVIVTTVCNLSVIYTLVTLRTRQSRLDASENPQNKRHRRATSQRFAEVQMMIMLIGITIIFSACFAPLIIFVLVCQTELQFDSRGWALSMIRMASFNPILDPWVYILFRRELIWRLVKMARCLLRMQPAQPPTPGGFQQSILVKDPEAVNGLERGGLDETEGGGSGGGKGPVKAKGMAWEDPYNPSCLAFCYQCLCLPPAPRVASRAYSVTTSKFTHSPILNTSRRTSSMEQSSPSMSSGRAQSPSSRYSNRLVMKLPSPSDQLLLLKMTEAGGGSSRSVNSTGT